jgi:hypothetical protein
VKFSHEDVSVATLILVVGLLLYVYSERVDAVGVVVFALWAAYMIGKGSGPTGRS